MVKYPLIKLNINDEELQEVKKVFDSGWVTQGPYVEEFEKNLAKYVGARYSLATTSCTTGMYLCLRALGVGQGDEVIVPDFTFPATGNVVLEVGAKPVLVDVKEDTFSLDPDGVKKAVNKRTKAVIIVHPFGHPAEIDSIMELARERGIHVIEDAATALGTLYKGRYAGNIGDFGCYSFHPRKLVTTGEGGMIVLGREEVYENLLALRNHGMSSDGVFETFSLNFRMSDIQAAVGLAQLAKLEKVVEERRMLAEAYNKILGDVLHSVRPFKERSDCRSTYQSYVVLLPEHLEARQERIIHRMRKEYDIEVQIGTYALHLEPTFRSLASPRSLPVAEMLRKRSLTLPLYTGLSIEDLEYISQSLAKVCVSEGLTNVGEG